MIYHHLTILTRLALEYPGPGVMFGSTFALLLFIYGGGIWMYKMELKSKAQQKAAKEKWDAEHPQAVSASPESNQAAEVQSTPAAHPGS